MEEEDRSVKPELQAELRTFCVQACHGKSKGSFRTQTSAVMNRFPGAMAADLSETDLWHKVKAMPYVACEKSDGTRYLLAALGDRGVFLISREWEMSPWRLILKGRDGKLLDDTLLDGELVTDTEGDPDGILTELPVLRFLVFDAMRIGGRDLTCLNLLKRLETCAAEVFKPRIDFLRECAEKKAKPKEDMDIFMKDFFDLRDVSVVIGLSKQKRLPHPCDGVILTPVLWPYTPGSCPQLLKWKPPEMNT
eukprot:Cvel_29163.t1-p1 / transcript=Cvel_29163.t1 / gene=Cvel_29163 / organism=Chromera_velia_CCMP2878 / gene_product=mRNA-capping enzyme subunit alpha, putative / transcript_product=mRNA-capping enzyme subunit alpha, putative / location=Cvel_scaffold3945:10944-12147(+) / protein_length=249 / sequence_SO=supercontig / SO=protein_coding / is_pseudo=false